MPLTISESIAGRDRLILLGGIVAISLLAWLYLARMAADAGGMQAHAAHLHGGIPAFWLVFVMWTVMMIAMMLPSASPFVLCFAAVHRRRWLRRRYVG